MLNEGSGDGDADEGKDTNKVESTNLNHPVVGVMKRSLASQTLLLKGATTDWSHQHHMKTF